MKKALLLTGMACVGFGAQAQSAVTLFGVADATFQRGTGSLANRTQLGSNGLSTTRVGFRGIEDLGGGLSASFWLEAGLNVDSGTGTATNTNNQTSGTGTPQAGGQGVTFNRRSTVSLAGSWGELRLGRDFSVQYYNRGDFDPFGNNGVGTSQTQVGSLAGPVNTRVSNSIMYFLPPSLGGFYGEAQYYLGENASNAGATKEDGTGGGLRAGYRTGPFNFAIAHARTQYAQTVTTGDITSTNIGGRYDWGSFSVLAGYYRDRVGATTGLTGTGPQFGGVYRVGPGEIKAQWSSYKTTAAGNPETKKISLGYVHSLSKRTAIYGTYARVRNTGAATTSLNGAATAANQTSSGFDVGVRHTF